MALGDGVSIRDFAKVVGDALKYVAPTFVGKRYLARETTPPRYVWVMAGEDLNNAPTYQMEDDHALADSVTTVVIHCWARSSDPDLPPEQDDAYDRAEALRDALVTAFRSQTEFNAQARGAVWNEPEDGALGVVISQTFTFTRAILEQTIPTTPAAQGEGVSGNLSPAAPEVHPGVSPNTFTITDGLFPGPKPDGWLETREPE